MSTTMGMKQPMKVKKIDDGHENYDEEIGHNDDGDYVEEDGNDDDHERVHRIDEVLQIRKLLHAELHDCKSPPPNGPSTKWMIPIRPS